MPGMYFVLRALSIKRLLFLLGTENEPPTSKELENVRKKAISKLEEIGSKIIPADLERIRSNDEYVSRYSFSIFNDREKKIELLRFWKHVFDQPGDQTEEAVNCIVKALKWRWEFGADKLTEETINMSLVRKGSLYSHNRDKV